MHSRLENKINYKFSDKKLCEEALTHKSYSAENNLPYYNERLEFLGDSVISLVVCDYLFKKYPDKDEGYLSKIKSYIVSKNNLADWAKRIELQNYLKLARPEVSSGGALNPSILSNCFEALVGAIYLDSNFDMTKKIIVSFLENEKKIFNDIDFKSRLQEYVQKKHRILPKYEILFTKGPEHKKTFIVNLTLKGKVIAIGSGKNKKEAEQNAAKNALSKLEEEISHPGKK